MIIKDLGDGWTIEVNDNDGDVELCRIGITYAWISAVDGQCWREAALRNQPTDMQVEALIQAWRERKGKP